MLTATPYHKTAMHTISPYVGKLRPEVASFLIQEFSNPNDNIFDPFSGSGTVPLEAWVNGRTPIASDLNPYAFVLTKAKLHPFKNAKCAVKAFKKYKLLLNEIADSMSVFLNDTPEWVKSFFHPQTLFETYHLAKVFRQHQEWFLLACLLGILHHQRPGFLSYPSSHGAPYLREKKFPKNEFPELYEYRALDERMICKIERTYKNFPELNFSIKRDVRYCDATSIHRKFKKPTVIITSPPYMKSLTYARDNRLRLWFLGYENWSELDKSISSGKNEFVKLMHLCFRNWSKIQQKNEKCIFVMGDIQYDRKDPRRLPEVICEIAANYGYRVNDIVDYPINTDRKIEKKPSQIATEKICILQRGRA